MSVDKDTADAAAKLDEYASEISPVDQDGKRIKQADLAVKLAQPWPSFHDTDNRGFIVIPTATGDKVIQIGSKDCILYLRREYYQHFNTNLSTSAAKDAQETLLAIALYERPQKPVFQRIGADGTTIYIDLGEQNNAAIQVNSTGWRIVNKSPVAFIRNSKPMPLIRPARKGDITRLWRYVKLPESDRILLLAWLLAALAPWGPYPIALIIGEQGAGKSTFARLLKFLVDPSFAPLRPSPKDEEALLVAVYASWLVAFDNLSGLTISIADMLCRIATGGAISVRELYTNLQEILIQVCRPIILNGINDMATRPDLADRSIIFRLQPMLDGRMTESEYNAGLQKDAPYILAALLDGMVQALRGRDEVKMDKLPRMADFATWATAGVSAFGYTQDDFLTAYAENRRGFVDAAIEANPVASAIEMFMKSRQQWTGSTNELRVKLQGKHSELPDKSLRSDKGMINALERTAPALREIGITYHRDRIGSARVLVLKNSNPTTAEDYPF